MRECCGTCKWNKYDRDGGGVRQCGGFYCTNEESFNCGCPTFFDDSCDDWEENDDSEYEKEFKQERREAGIRCK